MAVDIPASAGTINTAQWEKVKTAVANTDEPARRLARVTGVVSTLVVLAAAFGFSLDDQTRNAMTAVGVLLFPTFVALGELIRARVVPVAKANALIEASYKMTPIPTQAPPKV